GTGAERHARRLGGPTPLFLLRGLRAGDAGEAAHEHRVLSRPPAAVRDAGCRDDAVDGAGPEDRRVSVRRARSVAAARVVHLPDQRDRRFRRKLHVPAPAVVRPPLTASLTMRSWPRGEWLPSRCVRRWRSSPARSRPGSAWPRSSSSAKKTWTQLRFAPPCRFAKATNCHKGAESKSA